MPITEGRISYGHLGRTNSCLRPAASAAAGLHRCRACKACKGPQTSGLTVYRCLHGTAPEYLSELFVHASTRSSRHCLRSSDSNKLVVPPVKLSTYGRRSFTASGFMTNMCGTASPNTSETQHYPLIRLDAILKHTFFARYINIHATLVL